MAGYLLTLTLRPSNWLMAADSFKVHSACTTGLISFMYNMKAFSGFLICVSFFLPATKQFGHRRHPITVSVTYFVWSPFVADVLIQT